MRSRIGLFAFAFGTVSVALGSERASATDCSGPLSPCVNDDTLWPHAGPARFEAVGSARTLESGQLGFGLVATYLSRPIVVRLPGGRGEAYPVRDQANGTFLWSYGVSPRLELDLALPMTFGQSGDGLGPLTGGSGLPDTALRDLRFGLAYALANVRSPSPAGAEFDLAIRLEVAAPTGDRDQFAGERSGVFVPGVAASLSSGQLFAGAELGARVRPTTEFDGARIGTQIVTALGFGVDLLGRELLSAQLEAWALPTVVAQAAQSAPAPSSTASVLAPAEWQLSLRTAPLAHHELSLQLGGGGVVPFSGDTPPTSPRLRFVFSLRWAPPGETW